MKIAGHSTGTFAGQLCRCGNVATVVNALELQFVSCFYELEINQYDVYHGHPKASVSGLILQVMKFLLF